MGVAKGCSVVSSNCVTWQGPDIPCIDLCKGDSITEIIEKLANELCALSLPNVDIATVDFKCLIEGLGANPTLISEALQLIVNKHCDLKTIVDNITPGTDPQVVLPICLQQAGITQQPVSEYVLTVANKVCENVSQINQLISGLNALESRVTSLENAIALIDPSITLPTVNTTCLGGAAGVQLDIGLQTIIDNVCSLRNILGTDANLVNAIAAQCTGLATAPALSTPGTMSDLPGWVLTPTTIADTIQNIWAVICDMRGLVTDLDSAVQPKCKDVVLDFEVSFSADRTAATLQLFKYSDIPTEFTNRASSAVTFSDGVNTYTNNINPILMSLSAAENITYSVLAMGLDVTRDITVTVNSDLTTPDGNCDKLKTKTYDYVCLIAPPTSVSISPSASNAIISWTPPNTAEQVVRYSYQLLVGGSVVRNGTSTTNTITLGSLDPGVAYEFRVRAEFSCGNSEYASNTFTTACYVIESVGADFDPCLGGAGEDYLGGDIRISAPAEQQVSFSITVIYWDPSFSSDCTNVRQVNIFGFIPAGQTIGIISPCSSGVEIPGGVVCSVQGELLNGCASGNLVGQTCSSPTGLTSIII